MKPAGYSLIYINGEPHVAIHTEDGHEWPVLSLADAEKVMRWIANAIDDVKTEQQRKRFLEHLDRATKHVESMPEWKRNLLGIVARPMCFDSPDD